MHFENFYFDLIAQVFVSTNYDSFMYGMMKSINII